MEDKYIGIENELITYRGERVISFVNEFPNLTRQFKKAYSRGGTAIRTDTGHGFYVDGSEIEILTPPILINRGFATRVTNSLLIGRDKVINSNQDLTYTGFSMHWNLSRPKGTENTNYILDGANFFKGIAIPFHLFCLNPLSIGLNLRDKHDNESWRYELLGDSLNNPDQINASALLLGSYLRAYVVNHFPLNLSARINSQERRLETFLPDGRYSSVEIIDTRKGETSVVQAQQFLESFYDWLKPVVQSLGTKTEIANLEAFIYQNKPLEFDNFKYYAQIKNDKNKIDGRFLPYSQVPGCIGTVLTKSGKSKLPLENRLLGRLVSKKLNSIHNMEWDYLYLGSGSREKELEGIRAIYNYAAKLFEKSPILLNGKTAKPAEVTNPATKRVLAYDPDKDSFPLILKNRVMEQEQETTDPEMAPHSTSEYLPSLFRRKFKGFIGGILPYATIALICAGFIGNILSDSKNKHSVTSELIRIENYVSPVTNSINTSTNNLGGLNAEHNN